MSEQKALKQPMWVTIAEDAGKTLWGEYGGVSDRHQRQYLKLVAQRFRRADSFSDYAVEITNHNPRGLCTLVFPDTLRSLDSNGIAMFITPCGASKEGEHFIPAGWAAAIDPNDSANIAAAVRDMGTGVAGAKDRLMEYLMDINIYPLATSLKNQNEFRPKKDQLTAPTVEGSHIWARGKSDVSNFGEMSLLAERLEGIEKITDLIGDSDQEIDASGKLTKRGEFVQWYGQALKARLNAMARVKKPLNDDSAHDLAAIICATLAKPGNLVLTPRKIDPNESFYLMRFSGMSRCYHESVPPTQSHLSGDTPDAEGNRKYPHYIFGDATWAKIVVKRKLGNVMHITEIRPLERKRIGHDMDALTNPIIQEILVDPDYDLDQMKFITVFGSEMAKKFGGVVDERVTSMGADGARARTARLPDVQAILAPVFAPAKK